MLYLIITLIMAIIFLAIYLLGGVGAVAIFEDDGDSKKGCFVIIVFIVILFIILLMLRGLRSFIS